jgi:ArsR family transcriptional regulator
MTRKCEAEIWVEIFAALADPTRLRLLNLIAGQEVCVCHLVEILRQAQPKISRHLAYLRRAGLVAARREGKWMHYHLCLPSEPAAAAILAEVLKRLGGSEPMQSDRALLQGQGCARPDLAMLGGAR